MLSPACKNFLNICISANRTLPLFPAARQHGKSPCASGADRARLRFPFELLSSSDPAKPRFISSKRKMPPADFSRKRGQIGGRGVRRSRSFILLSFGFFLHEYRSGPVETMEKYKNPPKHFGGWAKRPLYRVDFRPVSRWTQSRRTLLGSVCSFHGFFGHVTGTLFRPPVKIKGGHEDVTEPDKCSTQGFT